MKNWLYSVLLLIPLLALCGCGDEQGILRGKVSFQGLPCQPGQPDYRVPPCTGPFPSYELAVFDPDDLESPVVTTTTNGLGTYQLTLPVGEYVIFTQNGPKAENRKANRFEIEKDAVTSLDLAISTGIL
ncbi:MAG: hypothetical protein AAGN35_08680 [Bacteroidota bacterium]